MDAHGRATRHVAARRTPGFSRRICMLPRPTPALRGSCCRSHAHDLALFIYMELYFQSMCLAGSRIEVRRGLSGCSDKSPCSCNRLIHSHGTNTRPAHGTSCPRAAGTMQTRKHMISQRGVSRTVLALILILVTKRPKEPAEGVYKRGSPVLLHCRLWLCRRGFLRWCLGCGCRLCCGSRLCCGLCRRCLFCRLGWGGRRRRLGRRSLLWCRRLG